MGGTVSSIAATRKKVNMPLKTYSCDTRVCSMRNPSVIANEALNPLPS
jgi:hypothetical protein